MLIIFYGLAGSGKTFIGNLLQEKYDFHFEDGDNWLTDEMQQCLNSKLHFSDELLEQFITNIISNINDLQKTYNKLVIAQGLYYAKHRNQIKQLFPDVIFIEVRTNQSQIENRLITRADWINIEYAKSMQVYFQSDPENCILDNNQNGTSHLILQLNQLFK